MSSKIKYITPEDLLQIVNIIQSIDYLHQEEIPNYDAETESIDKYFALIERSGTDYYPDVYSKAAFLIINLNNHYFSNGNKRLAFVTTLFFLTKNKLKPKRITDKKIEELFLTLFKIKELKSWKEFDSKMYGLFNLSLFIASRHEPGKTDLSEEDLKEKVAQFFKEIFV